MDEMKGRKTLHQVREIQSPVPQLNDDQDAAQDLRGVYTKRKERPGGLDKAPVMLSLASYARLRLVDWE